MGKDLYLEKVTSAKVENGIVTVGCGVGEEDYNEETVRIRIPLPKFQEFCSRFRDILIGAMEDGWYGEDGKKAAGRLKEER